MKGLMFDGMGWDVLQMYKDSTVVAIYASHVLEHASLGVGPNVSVTLKEWHRVLKNGGEVNTS